MGNLNVLFDLDGTISDSGAGIIHGFRIVLGHYGLPMIPAEQERTIVGPPLRDSFLRFGITPEVTDEAVEIYRKFYIAEGQFENFVYPGIEEMLKYLKEHGCRLYVATSKPDGMSISILRRFGLADYFEIICGSAEDRSRDTKAKVIRHLLQQMDADGPIVMVGDTVYDVEGAAALGLPAIGVTWGYGDKAQMQQAGAIGLADNPAQLTKMLLDYRM